MLSSLGRDYVAKIVGLRRNLLAGLAALALLAPAAAVAAAPKDPSGVWLTEDGRARIQLELCGAGHDRLCGYIVWLKTPTTSDGKPRTDTKNPDAAKQARLTLGHQLLLGLKPNDEGHYEGEIYNSDDGKKYDVNVWLDAPGRLKVKGCLVAFLCSTQDWTKTADVLPGQLVGAAGSPGGPRPDPEWASTAPGGAPGAPAGNRTTKPRS
jgi:uncharacterized protein (DUF2147 family)